MKGLSVNVLVVPVYSSEVGSVYSVGSNLFKDKHGSVKVHVNCPAAPSPSSAVVAVIVKVYTPGGLLLVLYP